MREGEREGGREKASTFHIHTTSSWHTFQRHHEYVLVEVGEWKLVKESNKVTLLQQIGVPFTISLILSTSYI